MKPYKQKNGTILYGFSQTSLDENTKAIMEQSKIIERQGKRNTKLFWVCVVLIFLFLLFLGYHNIPTNIAYLIGGGC